MQEPGYLELMGVQCWQLRQHEQAVAADNMADTDNMAVPIVAKKVLVEETIPCPLCLERDVIHFRTTVETSSGSKVWYWLISAFGRQGKFSMTTQQGQLLLAILKAVGSSEPGSDHVEVLHCEDLSEQVCADNIRQKLLAEPVDMIVSMGLSLSRLLLQFNLKSQSDAGDESTVVNQLVPADLSSAVHSFADVPLLATLHLAELIDEPLKKRQVWEDLQRAMAV
ncbi:MAG: hypothetical protein ACRBHB_10275 [Arenicella sp.]